MCWAYNSMVGSHDELARAGYKADSNMIFIQLNFVKEL